MPYTHGHAIVNIWLLDSCLVNRSVGLSKDKRLWIPIFIGGILPDIPLLIFMFIEIPKYGASVAFDDIYHNDLFWQDVFGYAHSIPLSMFGTILFAIPLIWSYAKVTQQQISTVIKNFILGAANVCFCCFRGGKKEMSSSSSSTSVNPEEGDGEAVFAAGTEESGRTTTERDGNESNIVVVASADEEEGGVDDDYADSKQVDEEAPSTSMEDNDKNINDDSPSSQRTVTILFWSQLFCFFFTSIFLHSFADIWLHTDDAHSQLLPISRIKFHSKISYYNVEEYAWIWIPIETTLVFIASRYMLSKKQTTACWFRWFMYIVILTYILILGSTIVGAILLIV